MCCPITADAAQPCANWVDQIEPRESWFRIKMLWTTGGCLLHDPTFNVSYEPYYDVATYPRCGAEMSALREAWNWTLTNAGLLDYPFDCVLMGRVHEANASFCPPIPEWSGADGRLTPTAMAHARGNWTDTPAKCEIAPDLVSLLLPLGFLILALTVYSQVGSHDLP